MGPMRMSSLRDRPARRGCGHRDVRPPKPPIANGAAVRTGLTPHFARESFGNRVNSPSQRALSMPRRVRPQLMWVRFGLHAVEVLVVVVLVVLSIPRTCVKPVPKRHGGYAVGVAMGLFVVMSAGEVSCTMSLRIGTPNWLGGSVQAPRRNLQAPPQGPPTVLARDGQVWPDDHEMPTHKGCTRVPIPA